MTATGAQVIASFIESLGVEHVFGVGGANIEDLFLAVQQRRPRLTAILAKHEHAAGTAADAYARLRRSIGVVMVTSGGGALNLTAALGEAMASRVSVLAIVGEPPTALQGCGAFQDTSGVNGVVDVRVAFGALSVWCERVRRADDLPVTLAAAARAAWQRQGPAVLLVAKDVQQATTAESAITAGVPDASTRHERDAAGIDSALELLRTGASVIIAGDEVARADARAELTAFAQALGAPVAVTPDARDAFDNGDSSFVGVAGAMGHKEAATALAESPVWVLVGTRLPLLARTGHESLLAGKALLALSSDAPFVSGATTLHVDGSLRQNLRALTAGLDPAVVTRRSRRPPDGPARFEVTNGPLTSAAALGLVQRVIPDDAVVLIDAGNTGAQAVHHLTAPRDGRWLVAMGMAGMGYTFGAAVGAACATGRRCFVFAGDGAFYMHGLDIHTAVQHHLPITYVIFNNRAHGMCLVRERLLLGAVAGYNEFGPASIGRGLHAMFPALPAADCGTGEQLSEALQHLSGVGGPAVVCVELDEVETPPFVTFRIAAAAAQGEPR